MKDFYKILKIKEGASKADIKSAYYSLAKVYHPDNLDTGNAEKFREISFAYQELINKKEPTKSKFSPVIPDIFVDIEITLEEAFNGCIKTFVWEDDKERKIRIPKGIRSKKVVIEPKQGNILKSGQIGDIIATIYVLRKDGFLFDEDVLVQLVDVDIIKALTGGRELVKNIDGKYMKIDIPQGFQEGTRLTISSKGWRVLGKDNFRDNLIVELHIKNRRIEFTDKELRQLRSIGNK